MRSATILSSALLLASTCAAWPTGPEPLTTVGGKQEAARLEKRDSTSSPFNLGFTGKEGNTATTVSSTSQSSGSSSTGTGSSSGTITGTDSKQTGTATTSGHSSGKKSGGNSEPTTQTFDILDPAGGLSMITPAVTAQASYYKIKDFVTFAWNYTSLSVTPSFIDILASCSSNQETWTLAANTSVTGPTQALTWDTAAFQTGASQPPLLTGEYTLIIYDAQKPMTAVPSPGYLAPFSQFTFGMYLPQPYQDRSEWVCVTCSAGVTAAQVQTVWFLLGTTSITILSAAWFTGVAGLW